MAVSNQKPEARDTLDGVHGHELQGWDRRDEAVGLKRQTEDIWQAFLEFIPFHVIKIIKWQILAVSKFGVYIKKI